MTARFAVTFLLLAVPAFGQSRVYTNADLGKIERTRTVTEEELASLRANQFVYVPPRSGPEVIVVGGSTAEGPFGPFYMPPREPLGNQFWSDYGYGHSGGFGRHVRGPVTVTVPNLSFPPPITVPEFARGPVVPEFARGPVSLAPPAPYTAPSGDRRRRGSRD